MARSGETSPPSSPVELPLRPPESSMAVCKTVHHFQMLSVSEMRAVANFYFSTRTVAAQYRVNLLIYDQDHSNVQVNSE